MRTTREVQEWVLDDKTMVLLGVEGETELRRWMRVLELEGVLHSTFVEPDIGNERTATAVHPGADPRIFRRLKLL